MTNYFKHKMRTKKPGTIAAMIVLGIIAATAFVTLFGFVIMWLWNWLMPEIFGLISITYWQAVGLLVLFKILFSGFHSGNHNKKSSKRHVKCNDSNGKNDFSKWKHYEKYWKEEGNEAFESYVSRETNSQTEDQ